MGREVGGLPVLGLILPSTHDEQIGIPIWSQALGIKTPKNLQPSSKNREAEADSEPLDGTRHRLARAGLEFSLTRIQLVPS